MEAELGHLIIAAGMIGFALLLGSPAHLRHMAGEEIEDNDDNE